ncbi:FAD binding domain-containing protein [Oceanirhabdus sp. W0125-5]|uniref:FAD binding domain-containing protein n=1 Tax=Oceanirhabdus sp. W0125-5 TaxID=2999116 RepID=UPI0022F31487|nr:FAD binding domain-containing protein [Oceanirhabdus sp. W0125-5]WBW95091.1 FAD binding domain-containing protein [Oceanirhabdus sp. W0125-5]
MVNSFIPSTLDETLELLNKHNNITIIAGGTDLMVRNKRWSGTVPKFNDNILLVDNINDLRDVHFDDEFIKIGSGITLTEIAENKRLPSILRVAAEEMASPAIRNIATIGGNIINASPAGDLLPPLYALDSKLVIKSTSSTRIVPIKDFITGPGKTIIEKNELLVSILFENYNITYDYYKKVGTRNSTALSKLSFCGVKIKKGEKEEVRIAFGAVAPTIVKSERIENQILDELLKDANKIINVKHINEKIIKEYDKLISPITDQRSTKEYRRITSLKLLEDFLTRVFK